MPRFTIPYYYEIKTFAKGILRKFSSLVGRSLLDRPTSFTFLEESIVSCKNHPPLTYAGVKTANGVSTFLSEAGRVALEPDYVWCIHRQSPQQTLQVGRRGTPIINRKLLLNLDFNSTADILDSSGAKRSVHYPIVIAPWSHPWGAYYDFVIFILAKLCRIEQALDQEVWQAAKICYPFRNTAFEAQFLDKLGIPESARINSNVPNLQIETDCLIVANNQPDMFYCSPSDIALLRARFLPERRSQPAQKRLFIARAGTRKVRNEAAVRALLTQEFEFEIVEDIARTVDEQIDLFRQAAIIVAPHGSGLANLIWCNPGTQVVELFCGAYMPRYYYYLCNLLGFKYTYLVDLDPTYYALPEYSAMIHDMQINVGDLRDCLREIVLDCSVLSASSNI